MKGWKEQKGGGGGNLSTLFAKFRNGRRQCPPFCLCMNPSCSLPLRLCLVVVYVCCPPDIFHELILDAHHEGLTKGEYAFFFIDLFGAILQSSHFPDRRLPWQRGDGRDTLAREAYKVSACSGHSSSHPAT